MTETSAQSVTVRLASGQELALPVGDIRSCRSQRRPARDAGPAPAGVPPVRRGG